MTFPASATLATYGGLRSDYTDIEDPTTDLGAAAINEVFADAAGMTHTAIRAWYCALGRATTNGALSEPGSAVHDAVWGDSNPNKPSAARTATGTYEFTWPATVTDMKGVTVAVNFRRAMVQFESNSTVYFMNAVVTAANKITVYVRNASSTLVDAANVPILVMGL